MTPTQIAAVVGLVIAALVVYGKPLLNRLALPARSVGLLDHIRDVIAVREYYRTPEVERACNALLEALLGVSKK